MNIRRHLFGALALLVPALLFRTAAEARTTTLFAGGSQAMFGRWSRACHPMGWRIPLLALSIMALSGHAQYTFSHLDVNSGTGDSDPRFYASLDGKLYFEATTDATGGELWVTDGTAIGTQLVKDIRPGSGNSLLVNLFPLDGRLFFKASDGSHGNELWVTDGTTAGTVMVKDIHASSGGYSGIGTGYMGSFYFNANDGVNNNELWVSNGTEAGTMLLKEICPGPTTSDVGPFFTINGTLYFSADDCVNGAEVWVSDGTDAGTMMLADINPGAASASPGRFTAFNGEVLFHASREGEGPELWITDGSVAGTRLVKDINPGSASSYVPLSGFTVSNGRAYFAANDGSTGLELWVTDGTEGGTQLVKDINPGMFSGLSSSIRRMASYDGRIYFAGNDGVHGTELWVTDGTSAGTYMLNDIHPSGSADPGGYVVYGDKLYFIAKQADGDWQLYVTDGTEVIAPNGSTVTNALGGSSGLYFHNDELWFAAAYTSAGNELWRLRDMSIPQGMAETDAGNGFGVYPNPGDGHFTITLERPMGKETTIQLHDVVGRLVHSAPLGAYVRQATLSLPQLPHGVYHVRIGSLTRRLVVER